MKHVLAGAIRGYQFLLSPWLGNQCRFYPTCSEFARLAIIEHGALRGGWLALCRTLKCHPWHAGGIDLVPENTHRHGTDTISSANEKPHITNKKPDQS